MAINESCVLKRNFWNRTFFIVLVASKVLIRDLLLDQNHCIYPHDLWVKNSQSSPSISSVALTEDSGWFWVAAGLGCRHKMASPKCLALWQKSQAIWAQLCPLFLHMVSKSLYIDSPIVVRVLIWQLRTARTRMEVARPLKPRPDNWNSVTSTVLYVSKLSQSLLRFKGRKHLSLKVPRNFQSSVTCSKGLRGKHTELEFENLFRQPMNMIQRTRYQKIPLVNNFLFCLCLQHDYSKHVFHLVEVAHTLRSQMQ